MSEGDQKPPVENDSGSEDSGDDTPVTPKKPAGLPSISIPKNFVKIPVERVSELVKSKEASVAIIDVRDADYEGGNIPESVHASYGSEFETKLTDLVNQYGLYKNVIFCCMYGQLRSPSCALGFIKKKQELQPNTPTDNVFVLSGGFHDYLVKFHDDSSLITNYKAECWSLPEFLHIRDADVKTFRPGAK